MMAFSSLKNTKTSFNRKSGFWASFRTFLMALLLALLFRSFVAQPFMIPSGSMKPTLQIGDYLFVEKYAYGFSRYSFPIDLSWIKGRILEKLPNRGDVAVFRLPTNPKIDYIKRIIGLPGDHIRLSGSKLFINDAEVPQERIFGDFTFFPLDKVYETLGPKKYTTFQPFSPNSSDELNYYVPNGHVFALGDNRSNSLDSRFAEVGFIPIENLVGRAAFVFFSIKEEIKWWQIWLWPFSMRSERFFQPIT